MNKNIFYTGTLALALAFTACSDDNDGPFLTDSDIETGETSIELLAPATGGSYILDEAYADSTWESYSWTDANDVAIGTMEYFVEVSAEGSTEEPVEIGPYTSQPINVTESDINNALALLGFDEAGTQVNAYTRVKQAVGTDKLVYYSEQISASIIVYGGQVAVEIPTLWVPGSYQGWTPDNTFEVYSMDDDGIYTGYLNMPNATDEFKLTKAPNWSGGDYGGTSTGISGTLTDGGDNIKFTGTAGAYLLTANTVDMTWELTEAADWEAIAHSWGVLGDATSGGWETDTDLTFSQVNGLLEVSITLTDGEIKFRADDGWALSYGGDTGNGVLSAGGDNIPVTAGTYNISLDFRNPAQVTYTIVAQ